MTTVRSTAFACGALIFGFALGMQAGNVQSAEEQPIDVASVNHVSVFVHSVEQVAQMHSLLLGTEMPRFSEPPNPLVFPPDFTGDRNSHPRYGHIPLQGIRIELMEPVGGESRWRDFLAEHGQGIEHLGFLVPDVPGALARFQEAGGKLIMGGCEGCTAHVDMREQLGYIVELMPMRR